MTKEEKELLLNELCTRLPYEVAIDCRDEDSRFTCYLTTDILREIQNNTYDWECKPYLFPLSSMTSEQLFEVSQILGKNEIEIGDGYLNIIDSKRHVITYLEFLALLEWFNKNHFDYRGLIPMGLANDATGLNIY